MRLLLDEHISPVVGNQLRQRGHDVVAVVDRPELRGSDGDAVLSLAACEGRALVTADVGFIALATRASAAGDRHTGVVMISRRLRRARGSIGPLVRALDDLLVRSPADDALVERMIWLRQW